MTRTYCFTALVVTAIGCDPRNNPDPYDLDFNIPRTESFTESLLDYGIYTEPIAALQPAEGVIPYELSSQLFTDYASKQRLMKIPEGRLIASTDATSLEFPEGSILAKTFYYPSDMGDTDSPNRVIETRLLVKTEGLWNVATYLWNDDQTDATLLLEGETTRVSWTDKVGQSMATDYSVPHEGECVTCHQSDEASVFIGPTPRNLNRLVSRDGDDINQLAFLVAAGVLEDIDWTSASSIPNHEDTEVDIDKRARAYLDVNCAHCHSPTGWDEAERWDLDFRYQTRFAQTGIGGEVSDIRSLLQDGEMPYLGTTLLHNEGVDLVLAYLRSL